jgi:hypothetical protein
MWFEPTNQTAGWQRLEVCQGSVLPLVFRSGVHFRKSRSTRALAEDLTIPCRWRLQDLLPSFQTRWQRNEDARRRERRLHVHELHLRISDSQCWSFLPSGPAWGNVGVDASCVMRAERLGVACENSQSRPPFSRSPTTPAKSESINARTRL